MNNLSDIGIVNIVSAKGGTGKTTSTINLASHIAEFLPTTIIEAQRINPQYKQLLFSQSEGVVSKISEDDSLLEFSLASESSVFSSEISDKISVCYLDDPSTYGEGIDPVMMRGLLRTRSEETLILENLMRKILLVYNNLKDKKRIFLIDQDAGLDKLTSMLVLPLHRAVHGYDYFHAVLESISIHGSEHDINPEDANKLSKVLSSGKFDELGDNEKEFISRIIFNPLCPNLTHKRFPLYFPLSHKGKYEIPSISFSLPSNLKKEARFGSGLILIVANPSIAELNGLSKRNYFFRDLGLNNRYALIVNHATDNDLAEITKYLKERMGNKFMFDRIFNLPTIYMPFGNVRAKGNPFLLPKYSTEASCVDYTNKIQDIASYIISLSK